MDLNPIDKAEELLYLFREYNPIIKRKSDKEYEWLEEETDLCIVLINPDRNSQLSTLEILCEDDGEFTLSCGVHAHYYPYDEEYKRMCETVLNILENRCCSGDLLYGEEKEWIMGGFFDREGLEHSVQDIFHYAFYESEYLSKKLQSGFWEAQYAFWNSKYDKIIKGGDKIVKVGKDIAVCEECGSKYLASKSKMASLCPECAHVLYGYENCDHVFENGKCALCLWDGSVSEYIKSLKNENKQ